MIRLALRFDDPSATSDHALEAAIFNTLMRYGIPITVAAIPNRRQDGHYAALAGSDAKHLVQAQRAGIIEIALHGYSHSAGSRTCSGRPAPRNTTRRISAMLRP